MKQVLFVCLGNICRSPLAHGLMEHRIKHLKLPIKVDSAALSHYHIGEPPCSVSQKLARSKGIDISYIRSQHISEFDLSKYDLIVAMDEDNKQELLALGVQNVKKLGDFGFDGKDVADLYYEPHKKEEAWKMIEKGTLEIIKLVV